MVNILIFGPPGSGKGTQSVKLAGEFNLTHLSMGQARAEISAEQSLEEDEFNNVSRRACAGWVVIEMIAAK